MQARDAGLLRLDDRVGQHLGEVGLRRGDAARAAQPHLGHAERAGRAVVGAHAAAATSRRWPRPTTAAAGWPAAGTTTTTPTSATGCSARCSPGSTGRPWRTLVHDVLLGPLGMTQTSYLPRPHAQPGWSVDHFTGVRTHEPLTSTGAMAPAGQLWSTVRRPGAVGPVPRRRAGPDLLDPSTLHEMTVPVVDDYGLGLRLDGQRRRRAGRPQRLDAGLPGRRCSSTPARGSARRCSPTPRRASTPSGWSWT